MFLEEWTSQQGVNALLQSKQSFAIISNQWQSSATINNKWRNYSDIRSHSRPFWVIRNGCECMENASNTSMSYRMGVPHNGYQLIFVRRNNAPTRVGIALRILQNIRFSFSSLRNSDSFLQFYFVLRVYSIFCAWDPSQVL
jgi:hypothetical protein